MRTACLAIACTVLTTIARADDDVRFELDNGIRVVIVPTDDVPGRVACGWVSVGGARDDEADGAAWMTRRLMYTAVDTPTGIDDQAVAVRSQWLQVHDAIDLARWQIQYPRWRRGVVQDLVDPRTETAEQREFAGHLARFAADYPEAFQRGSFGVGRAINDTLIHSGTTHDFSIAHIDLPAGLVTAWIRIESERAKAMTIEAIDERFSRLHGEIIRRGRLHPILLLERELDAAFWGPSRYGRPVDPTPGGVPDVQSKVGPAFRKALAPERLVLIVVGDIDVDRVRIAITELFGALQPRTSPLPMAGPAQPPQRQVTLAWEQPPRLALRYPTVARTDPDHAALRIAALALAENMLGAGAGIARISVEQDGRADAGAFRFDGILREDGDFDRVLTAWDAVVTTMATQPMAQETLDRIRQQVRPVDPASSPLPLTARLIAIAHHAVAPPADLDAVTGEMVRLAVAKHLDPANRFEARIEQEHLVDPADADFAALSPHDQQNVLHIVRRVLIDKDPVEIRRVRDSFSQQLEAATDTPMQKPLEIIVRTLQAWLDEHAPDG